MFVASVIERPPHATHTSSQCAAQALSDSKIAATISAQFFKCLEIFCQDINYGFI
jgi:hypothetical protein